MNKKMLLLVILGVMIMLFLSSCSGAKGILLEQEASNVQGAIVYYDDGTKVTLESGDQQLADLAKALANTKTEEKVVDSTTDPDFFTTFKYAVDLTYTDTTMEQIFSNDGNNFFRFINNDQSYVGGESSKVAKILEEIKSNNQ